MNSYMIFGLLVFSMFGLIPIAVLYLANRFLFIQLPSRLIQIIAALLFIVVVILMNLLYLPGPKYLLGVAFFGNFSLTLIVFATTLASLGVLIVWWFHGWYNNQYRVVLRNRLTLFFLAMVIIVVINKIAHRYMPLYAIHRADKVIKYIDDYKRDNGIYPDSFNVNNIVTPGLIGAQKFVYLKHDTTFTIEFRIPSSPINEDVFIYDPSGVFNLERKVRQWRSLYKLQDLKGGWINAYRD